MTGKYPTRADATNFFSGRRAGRFYPAPLKDSMPLSEITIAEALRQAGYRTAFFGKWHLGASAEYWPENQGFEINVGGHHRGLPPGGYFSPYRNPRLKDGPDGEHLTARLADEAIESLNIFKESPFFLFISFYTVHTPLQAPPKIIAKYKAKAAQLGTQKRPEFDREEQVWQTSQPRRVRIRQQHATYAAMVETLDQSVGRVLQALQDLCLDSNTIVLLT